jgi:hypothetical protein
MRLVSFIQHVALSSSHMSSFVHSEKPRNLRSTPDIKVISHRENMISKVHGTQGKKEMFSKVKRQYYFIKVLEIYVK